MSQFETGAIHRYRGLSTDPKPLIDREGTNETQREPPVGSVFTEIDTGKRFVYTASGDWQRQEQTVETLLNTLIDLQEQTLAQLAATHRGHEEHTWEEDVPIEE